eukprot:scaffold462_cov195-Pinguiococcus_pyrenoidosus.AAC.25
MRVTESQKAPERPAALVRGSELACTQASPAGICGLLVGTHVEGPPNALWSPGRHALQRRAVPWLHGAGAG